MNVKPVNIAKKSFLVLAACFLALAIGLPNVSCARQSSEPTYESSKTSDDFGTIKWPKTPMTELIPEPKSDYGEIVDDSSDGFRAHIGHTKKGEYESYVEACMEKGFNVDYSRQDTHFTAENAEGFSLTASYDKDEKYMTIDLDAPEDEAPTDETDQAAASGTETSEPEPPAEPEPASAAAQTTSGIRPEFKEAMDSYEKFFDEYCAFAKEYAASSNKAGMALQYAKMMQQYSETMEKLDALDENQMSSEEDAYYLEVMVRINQKISEAAAAMADA